MADSVLVIGGGLLGAAIARQVASTGVQVEVCSRHPRNHAGLWRRLEEGLTVRPGMKVWVAIGPSPEERGEKVWGEALPAILQKLEGAEVLVCGPGGKGEPGIDAFQRAVAEVPHLLLPVLYGAEDGWLWPAAQRIREGGVWKVERNLPVICPLFVEDAAKAAVAGQRGSIRGPESVNAAQLFDRLVQRYGKGSWSFRWQWWSSPAGRRAAA